MFIVLAVLAERVVGEGAIVSYGAGFVAVGIALMFQAYRFVHARLVVSPAGIRYRSVGPELTTPWSNVELIAVAETRRAGRMHTLVLLEPARPASPTRIARLWLRLVPAYARTVPLSPFTQPFINSRLEADIRAHCPRLFAT